MNISFLCRRSDEHAFRAICHVRHAATINAAFNLSSSAFGFADRCLLIERHRKQHFERLGALSVVQRLPLSAAV
ncbi:hypothetical protein [Paraburkholderia sp. MM5482-R1]|uniref:hypothetical protein n=1 Tax=unclassified Paraburkholderia TaxID=2615204 RepID=UPI003D1918E1